MTIQLVPIGRVVSRLADPAVAPRQADEGAPAAWIELDASVRDASRDIRPGDRMLLLTWLHKARRDVLRVHPRDDNAREALGVFNTRSADRPNPIGVHEVEVVAVDVNRFQVAGLEAVDGTPVLDVKPVLARDPIDR